MKKIFIISTILFSSIFLIGCARKEEPLDMGGVPTVIPTPFPTKPVEQTIGERPYVVLQPGSDIHRLKFSIKNIPGGTKTIEYELTYFADSEGNRLERGINGTGSPVEKDGVWEYSPKEEILFGTASCTTGKCKYKYDENVTEGMLSITLVGTSGKEKYSSAFRIQKGKEAKEAFTTGDGTFSLVSNTLPANSMYLTISSVGVPVPLPAGVIVKTIPYAVFPAVNGKGAVSFKTTVTGDIYTLVGKLWQKLVTKTEGNKLTAEFSNSSLFIVGQ